MNTRTLVLILLGILVGIGGAAAALAINSRGTGPVATTTPPVGYACNADGKACPDGTVVGRTGPNCEFPACPDIATPEKESTVARLNQRILTNGVHITPLEVVEDSRCPTDVQCIQAGTVRAKVRLEGPGGTQIETMVLGSPIAFGNKHVTLMNVNPSKSKSTSIVPTDYRFTFSVAYGMGGDVRTTGTLAGTMTIGPVCPMERATNPCEPTPEMYAARKVAVYTSDKKTLIATLTPGSDGTFSAALAPGTYYVAMAAPQGQGVGGATGVPATIVIKSGATTRLAIDMIPASGKEPGHMTAFFDHRDTLSLFRVEP
jgi:hypothetical protein